MRFHETSAFCTALNSLATFDDFTVSLVKQEMKVVNAAMFHARHPLPSTFFQPNHRMNNTPAFAAARYSGGSADCHTLLRTALFS